MLQLLPWGVLAVLGMRLAWIDAREHRLPNRLVGFLTALVLIALWIVGAGEDDMGRFARALAGGVVLITMFGTAAMVHPAALGMGDVKLSFAIGMALTWLGWGWLWFGCVLAFTAAAGWGLIRRLSTGNAGPIALGPFLLAAPLGCALLTALI